MTTERVALTRPHTPAEEHAVGLLAQGLTCREVAETMGCSYYTARNHITNAAEKIPGDLPTQLRIVTWYRGGKTWIRPLDT